MGIIQFIITYWIEFLFGLITSFIIYLSKKISKYYLMINSTKDGVKVLLKGEIIRRRQEYKQQKSITLYEREVLNDLYKEYNALGGNGIIEDIIDDIDSLPISDGGD